MQSRPDARGRPTLTSPCPSSDGAAAHDLSEQGKQHQRRKTEIDAEARDYIYYMNNTDSPPGTIDLHGLYVKEGKSDHRLSPCRLLAGLQLTIDTSASQLS